MECNYCLQSITDETAYINLKDLRVYCKEHAVEDVAPLSGINLMGEISRRYGRSLAEAFMFKRNRAISVRLTDVELLQFLKVSQEHNLITDSNTMRFIIQESMKSYRNFMDARPVRELSSDELYEKVLKSAPYLHLQDEMKKLQNAVVKHHCPSCGKETKQPGTCNECAKEDIMTF